MDYSLLCDNHKKYGHRQHCRSPDLSCSSTIQGQPKIFAGIPNVFIFSGPLLICIAELGTDVAFYMSMLKTATAYKKQNIEHQDNGRVLLSRSWFYDARNFAIKCRLNRPALLIHCESHWMGLPRLALEFFSRLRESVAVLRPLVLTTQTFSIVFFPWRTALLVKTLRLLKTYLPALLFTSAYILSSYENDIVFTNIK